MFTIEKIGRRTRPYYIFENGELYAMFKTKAAAEKAISDANNNRIETAAIEAASKAERIANVAAYIEVRKDRKAAQPSFNF